MSSCLSADLNLRLQALMFAWEDEEDERAEIKLVDLMALQCHEAQTSSRTPGGP